MVRRFWFSFLSTVTPAVFPDEFEVEFRLPGHAWWWHREDTSNTCCEPQWRSSFELYTLCFECSPLFLPQLFTRFLSVSCFTSAKLASLACPCSNHKQLLSCWKWAHVVAAGVFLSSASWSWSIHSHPQRLLSIMLHLTPVHAACRIRATPESVVRKNSLLQLPTALFNAFCLWNSASP